MFRYLVATTLALTLSATACTGAGGPPGTPADGGGSAVSTIVRTETTTTTVPVTTTTIDPLEAVLVPPPPEEGTEVEMDGEGLVVLGRINVLFSDDATPDQVEAVAAALGGSVIGAIEYIRLYDISIPGQTTDDLKAAVAAADEMPGVEFAFIDHPVAPSSTGCVSTSPFASPQYEENASGENYEAIGVPEAWDIIEMSGIELHESHVGVADTYVQDGNSELSGSPVKRDFRATKNYWADADRENAKPSGGIEHGTAVVNVIGANPDDGGVVGVASVLRGKLTITTDEVFEGPYDVPATPDEADVLDTRAGAYITSVMATLMGLIKSGATVINMSFGSKTMSASNRRSAAVYKRFFAKIAEKYPEVVFVASAGNAKGALDGSNHLPGGLKLPNVITVAAIDKTGEKASFTNEELVGSDGEVTIAAPGVKIPVGVGEATGKTRVMSGTSFSAPMVTGAVALIKAINPDLSAAEIKDILGRTAYAGVPAASGDTSKLLPESLGKGVLRVDEAVLAVINDMRAKADPPLEPLTRERLLSLAKFDVEEKPTGAGDFTVTASVETIRDRATLSFELFDEGAVSGDSHVALTAPGSAQWNVTLADPTSTGSAKVCRVEAKRCCVVELESLDIPGTYEGPMVLEEVVAAGDIPIDIGGDVEVITKEQCEEATADAIGEELIQLTVTLAGDPGAATGEATGVLTNLDGDVQPFDPTTWTYDGDRVSFTMVVHAEGDAPPGTFTVSGAVRADPDDPNSMTIVGPWSLEGVPELTMGGTVTLVKRGSG